MDQEKKWLLTEKYCGKQSRAFYDDCSRLDAGEPLAYVIGHVPFLNTTISLDSHPLIPRPETEFWTEKALRDIERYSNDTIRVLDLCAGSGCIGVSILYNTDTTSVDFVEIDSKHHQTIMTNVRNNGIDEKRVRILGGSLFECIHTRYVYILSNPPYINPQLDRTEDSVRAYEPHQALYGGNDGLECIIDILTNAKNFLTYRGALYLEHEPEHKEALASLAQTHGYTVQTYEDQYKMPRYSVFCVAK